MSAAWNRTRMVQWKRSRDIYHDLFIFMGFPYVSSLFLHFIVVASSISLLSVHVPFPQDLSAPQMVFLQLCAYMLGLSPNFSVLLFIVLIVFLPHVIFLLFSSLFLLFSLSFHMCRATVIVLIVSSYLCTVEQITINTPVCCRVTSEQESASSPNSSCDPHTSTIVNSHTQLYTLRTSHILVTPH